MVTRRLPGGPRAVLRPLLRPRAARVPGGSVRLRRLLVRDRVAARAVPGHVSRLPCSPGRRRGAACAKAHDVRSFHPEQVRQEAPATAARRRDRVVSRGGAARRVGSVARRRPCGRRGRGACGVGAALRHGGGGARGSCCAGCSRTSRRSEQADEALERVRQPGARRRRSRRRRRAAVVSRARSAAPPRSATWSRRRRARRRGGG